ncbi:ribonuclease J [Nanobdella aerobiophila]|uniref:Ribonuclease J n=1 Tax=Nanobdella aerobiophila TaxID=2586965 RepID=A0A915SD09_9ARCH|nr:RNase J family beta-CASP ribonuclease [Nanobdella aerobiophila]BBL45838.1 ribonuclease J [Nanobdella aerobiophila]
MEIEVIPVGGYSYIGKNMTAIRIDDEIIIIDMGINVDNISKFGERESIVNKPMKELYDLDIIPNDKILENYKGEIKGIILTHGHLDHIGAVNFLAPKYNVPIYCTPYTAELLKMQEKEYGVILSNDIKKISPNSTINISDKLKINIINSTHSIPQSIMVDIITNKGHIVHTGDFKFDNFPLIGKRTNYEKLKEIGRENVLLLISESTRSEELSKAQSEIIEKYMLYDVLKSLDTKGIIITTFASHISRLKSIIELGKEFNRKVIFIGRSMGKYIKAAEETNLYNFSEESEVYSDVKEYKKILENINNDKEQYLLVVTGHQGEPGSVLDKLSKDSFKFDIKDSTIIFANNVIPHPINEANRKILEERLKRKGVNIIKDIHVSGHAKAQDHNMLIKMLNPENIVPNHGDINKKAAYYTIAEEKGYKLGEDIFFIEDQQSKIFNI